MLHTNGSTIGRGEKCLLYSFVSTFLGSRIAYLLHLKSEDGVGGVVGWGWGKGPRPKNPPPLSTVSGGFLPRSWLMPNPLGNWRPLTFHSTRYF